MSSSRSGVRAPHEADSSRVGITGQSSLYAVCWAPRQKHCWAVKQSVTETTCSRVEDGQTQTTSAAPHQESVPPIIKGAQGAPSWLQRNTLVQHGAFLYVSGNPNQEQIVPDKNAAGWWRWVSGEESRGGRKRNAFIWPDTFWAELDTSLAVWLGDVFIPFSKRTLPAPVMWHSRRLQQGRRWRGVVSPGFEAGVGRITRFTTHCAQPLGMFCKSKVSRKKIKWCRRFRREALSVGGVVVLKCSSYQRGWIYVLGDDCLLRWFVK